MAPGAAYGGAKQWPPERFARLARLLHERRGAWSILVGSRADLSASQRIEGGGPVVDLVGVTNLPLLVGLMARCRAFVSNDSGAMHLAAAVGLPVTAIFGPTDERGTARVLHSRRPCRLMRYSRATFGAAPACSGSARSTIGA